MHVSLDSQSWVCRCNCTMVYLDIKGRSDERVRVLGLYSLCGRASYRKISWSLDAARFGFRHQRAEWWKDSYPGTLFTKRTGVLTQDLVKPRRREIRVQTFPIALKFDRHLGSSHKVNFDCCHITHTRTHTHTHMRRYRIEYRICSNRNATILQYYTR